MRTSAPYGYVVLQSVITMQQRLQWVFCRCRWMDEWLFYWGLFFISTCEVLHDMPATILETELNQTYYKCIYRPWWTTRCSSSLPNHVWILLEPIRVHRFIMKSLNMIQCESNQEFTSDELSSWGTSFSFTLQLPPSKYSINREPVWCFWVRRKKRFYLESQWS